MRTCAIARIKKPRTRPGRRVAGLEVGLFRNNVRRLLREQFGDEYEAYCARTSRLIPRLY
jgi:hypothetical protein